MPVNHMKDFKPSNLDDFNRDQPYKYKPPGVPSSTYAFILALGGKSVCFLLQDVIKTSEVI